MLQTISRHEPYSVCAAASVRGSALRDANPHIANVAEIAHRFGFAELERFSETYQATFGEARLTTLQHVSQMRPSAP
jgi:hypothetical protein